MIRTRCRKIAARRSEGRIDARDVSGTGRPDPGDKSFGIGFQALGVWF